MGQKPFDRFFHPLTHMFASRCKPNIKRASTQCEKHLFHEHISASHEAFWADFLAIDHCKEQTHLFRNKLSHSNKLKYIIHLILSIFQWELDLIEQRSRITYQPSAPLGYFKKIFTFAKSMTIFCGFRGQEVDATFLLTPRLSIFWGYSLILALRTHFSLNLYRYLPIIKV